MVDPVLLHAQQHRVDGLPRNGTEVPARAKNVATLNARAERRTFAGGSGGSSSGESSVFRVFTTILTDAAVLHVVGEVDMSTAPSLAAAIAAAYDANRRVIVDLNRVKYLDGSGIRVLEGASATNRGRFAVFVSQAVVHRLFSILGLLNSLPVVTSLDAAREYLRPQ